MNETPNQVDSDPVPARPRSIRAAWVAGKETLHRFGRSLQPLAIGLMDELIELVALCPAHVDTRELPSPPVEIVSYGRLRWLGLRYGGATESLAGELRKRKIELLHALDASAVEVTGRLARLLDLRYVVSCYAVGDAKRLGRRDNLAVALLAPSEAVRGGLLTRHGIKPESVHLVRPGVYQVHEATCFTQPDRSVAIVAGGELDNLAAYEAVLRSFVSLRDSGFDCVFFLIGNGPAEKQLRSSGEKLGLRHELTFVDSQSGLQLTGILKAADIYVSPAPGRSIDMQALLAMAAGVPVVTASTLVDDVLVENETALTYAQGNSAELTSKLTGLIEDHPAAVARAQRALARLRASHSPAAMVSAVADVYRKVIEEPAK